jgi:rod shape-determining protein MreC
MFADSRFDYLSQVRYYASMMVTPVQYLADLPSRVASAVGGTFMSRSELQSELDNLRDQLLEQSFKLQKLEHLEAENARLNDLLKASAVVDDVVVRVQLTGESPDPYLKRVLINKGSMEGVFIGQPVLDASGLMGQVVEVEALTSWVLLITDPQHATPVQIERNGVRAIASGTRDSLHMLTLNNIPNTEDIEVGDLLVTSGLGGRFPPGYPVGVVSSVIHDPGQPFAQVLAVPRAQINRSRNLGIVFHSVADNSVADTLPELMESVPVMTDDSFQSAEPAAEVVTETLRPGLPADGGRE